MHFHSLYILIFTSFISIVSLYSQNVRVGGLFPKKAHSGSEIIVNFSFEKGDLNDFARFQIEVPVGITPSPRISKNAEFTFENNIVKLVWIKIPPENRFDISINFRISATVEGYKVFKGEFSYADKTGANKIMEMESQIVAIEKDEFRSDITKDLAFEYKYFSQKGVTCIRQKPYIDENNEIIVNILVSKGALNEFGRIEETIPEGYSAVSEKSGGAIFAFNKNRRSVKFMWMNLPDRDQYSIAYRLIPEDPDEKRIFMITGTFMFAENRVTHSVPITELDMDVDKEKRK